MKSNRINRACSATASPANSSMDPQVASRKPAVVIRNPGLPALLMFLVATATTWAQQTVAVRSQPVRVTVADSSTNSFVLTNFVDLANGNTQVNLSISGVPAGAGASLDTTAFTADGGASLTLNTTNVVQGQHVLGLDATGGATNRFLLTLQSGRMWNGSTDVQGNWSAPGSWVGGAPPGANHDVLFTQLGAQTNTAGFTNSVVDVDTEIASLRFSQTNGTDRFHTLHINPGRRLSITGTKGLSLLRDYTGVAGQMDVNITGADGALIVSNANANVALVIDNQQSHRLDLSGLGTFIADVNRIGLGDFLMYPNYTNLTANGFGGNATFLVPRRFIPTVRLARTNIITARSVDPNNYLDPAYRYYSLTLGNNETAGTSSKAILNFGISNAFFMDSICLIQSGAQGDGANNLGFNPALATNSPSSAYFRNTNGTRMSVFAIADAAAPGISGSGLKAVLNFSLGTVNALVDRLYISRERTNSNGATVEATLTMAAGVFDVNTAIIGFQGQGNNQGVTNADQRSYCRGTVNVNSNAVFKVNSVLELGHTTADAGAGNQAELGFGRINIGNSGTVMANSIVVGGVTKVSGDNTITITNGANLIVSNTVAGPDKGLATLTMNDSTLTLHVDGSQTDPYVYVTNLLTGGTGNTIVIASLVGVASYPATIALISYVGSASPNFSVTLPAGLAGYIGNNTMNKTIDVVITGPSAPNSLVWKGNMSGNWDTNTFNWVNGSSTNFSNGDFVTFNDTATGPTTVTVTSSVVPGQAPGTPGTTVSNSVKNYTLTGGSITGTGRTLKEGTGSLTIDLQSQPPLTINNGLVMVTANGSAGLTTVESGAMFTSAGLVGGLTTYGSSASAGTIDGPVSVQGGIFINSGNVSTSPGTMTIAAGTQVTNLAAGMMAVGGGNWSVETNATLANFGRITNRAGRLNINSGALLFGTGTVSDGTADINGNNGRLAINGGAIFSPGASLANSIGTFIVEGRFDLNQNARLIIEVDPNPMAPANDVVRVDKWSNIRGIIVMTNIGATSFSAGQSFLIVSNNFGLLNTPETANLDYSFEPISPGLGLVWDTSELITNGIVKIGTTSSIATNIISMVSSNVLTLSWPDSHIGWRLETQTNSLNVGTNANWMTVPNSFLTNLVNVPITTNIPAAFFRLAHP